VPWQTGFSIGVDWRWAPRWYAGARYTLFPASNLAIDDATISLGRHPFEALAGYRGRGPVALNAECGLLADRATRTTLRTSDGFQATSPDSRWLLALAARGGFSWSPWPALSAAMRVGADLGLTRYAYVVDSTRVAPKPRWLRPRVELELAVWLW